MVLRNFISNLNRRLCKYPKSDISEDSVRSDLFAALLQSGFSTEDIILELSHDNDRLSMCEVDLVIDSKPEKIAFELKYFKQIPSKKDDSTSYMAKLVVDLLKLRHLSAKVSGRYFVFVTDGLMFNYIKKDNNGFSLLYTSRPGDRFSIAANDKSGKHFQDIIEKTIPEILAPMTTRIYLKKIVFKPVSKEHYFGCFRVLPE